MVRGAIYPARFETCPSFLCNSLPHRNEGTLKYESHIAD